MKYQANDLHYLLQCDKLLGIYINPQQRESIMRKNIFIKSMLRQPIRTGLLILLVSLASFAFFLRTVEYVTVRSEILEISQLYRTVGAFHTDYWWQDVHAAADIIENSPYTRFVDRRFSIEGVIQSVTRMHDVPLRHQGIMWDAGVPQDMFNADFAGNWQWLTRDQQPRIAEAIFTARVMEFFHDEEWMSEYHAWLQIDIDYVFAGYPEHVVPGQQHQWVMMDKNVAMGMEIDGYYLFRGALPMWVSMFNVAYLPAIDQFSNLTILPLGGAYDLDVWPVTYGQPISFDIPELAHLPEEIDFFRHHHRAVHLQPTMDMTAMPLMQRGATTRLRISPIMGERYALRHSGGVFCGRVLNYYDYINANPVAVITTRFASLRRLEVGDTMVISIPTNQYITDISYEYWDFFVRGTPEDAPVYEIEVEIVGLVSDMLRGSVPGTFDTTYVYIPASLIPAGVTVTPPEANTMQGWDNPEYLPAFWFSFVLEDPRYEQQFLYTYQPILAELGVNLVIFESNPQDFWAVVDPIFLILTFNAVLFWIVLFLVLVLVAFLYLHQRRRCVAIKRALGFTVIKITWQYVVSAMTFILPAVALGGAIGWFLALGIAGRTLGAITEIVPGFVPDVGLTPLWFVGMAGLIVVVMLLLLVAGIVGATRGAVLDQLQGVKSKRVVRGGRYTKGEWDPVSSTG